MGLRRKGREWAAHRTSHTPAHESAVTVAPFRAWRGSQRIIARGPMRLAIESVSRRAPRERALCLLTKRHTRSYVHSAGSK
ncbi:protein of unknown function [Methylococcus capsulatus]|uniref:Uncharacterized protein n=1 Tax=Methylococcus capsulatus TaxID=414 RepID=A0AA35UT28_METCP|nr:protein of unknown function [Methylococcus capsulatus]